MNSVVNKHIWLKFIFVLVLTITLFNIVSTRKINAIVNNSTGIPTGRQAYNNGASATSGNYYCLNPGDSTYFPYQFQTWWSRNGDSSNEIAGGGIVDVPAGTNSVGIQLNMLGNHCTSNMDGAGSGPVSTSTLLTPIASNFAQVTTFNMYGADLGGEPAGVTIAGEAAAYKDIRWDSTYGPSYGNANNNFYATPERYQMTITGFDSLAPGDYYMSLFVGARAVNAFGTSSSNIVSYRCVSEPRDDAVSPNGPLCNSGGYQIFMTFRKGEISGCTDPTASNYNSLATIDDGSCTYPPLDCPTFTTRFHSVSMANTSFGLANVAGRSGTTSSAGTHTGRVLGNVSFTRSTDISTPGPAIGITTRNAVTGTTGSVDLDYKAFSDQYPYDTNRASATFTLTYEETNYFTTANTVDPPDPDGAGPLPNPPPYIADYTWNAGSPVTRTIEGTTALGGIALGPEMPPCYNRTFDTTPTPPASGLATLNDPENPSVAYVVFTFPTTYGVQGTPRGQLRKGTEVDSLSYTINYSIEGYTTTVANSSGSRSGTVSISASGLATSGNGDAISTVYSSTDALSVSVLAPVSNLEAGKRVCFTMTTPFSVGVVDENGATVSSNTSRSTTPPTCTEYVQDQPYSRFYGSDVFAGGGFARADGTCTPTPTVSASVRGRMKGTSVGDYRGTGAQLAVFAANTISSVQALATQTTRQPTELSFANSPSPPVNVNLGNREFGGKFGYNECEDDYFGQIPNTGVTWDNAATVDISTLGSGKHYYTGPVQLSGQLSTALDAEGTGRRVVIYVQGSATIMPGATSGNQFGYTSGTWNSVNEIPSLYVIARNIFIDSGVNSINGALIAQPLTNATTATDGIINTCSIGGSDLVATPDAAALTVTCRNSLTVRGVLLAKRVNLLRTQNSVRASFVGENYWDPTLPTRAAETIIYDPILWLTKGGGLPPSQKIQIDSYYSLPPAL